jgi:epsilon-lactone hydrolase
MTSSAGHQRAIELYRTVFPPRPDDGIDDVRARFAAMLARLGTDPAVAVAPVDAGGVPALAYTPEDVRPDCAMLWFHGGGYSIGSAEAYAPLATTLAGACRARIVVPDYRLAPEHPFPAAAEDAAAAARWVVESFDDVAVGGDSAGGALVFAALTALRDDGVTLPRRAVAVSPLVDLTARGASFDTNARTDPALSRRAVAGVRALYLQGADPLDPRASPVTADLRDLPPALVLASASEVLLDDARLLVGRIRECGGEATLLVEADMVHVWPVFAPILPEGTDAIKRIAQFLSHSRS